MKSITQHRTIRIALIWAMLITIESCSTFTVTSNQTPKSDETKSMTVVSYLWGLSDPDIKAECKGMGLLFVATKTNYLYSLCSVVTLGIVTPMTVQYRCAGDQLHEGTPFGN
jgi:hypothetical protein